MMDYWLRDVIDAPPAEAALAFEESRQLALSFFYWLQTEAPHLDGKVGYPGLFLRPDITGTADGLAMAAYIRESRRIQAAFTVTEQHVGTQMRYGVNFGWGEGNQAPRDKPLLSERFADTVGIGHYRIDLHPSTGGNNYIDFSSLPFQIPLGALLPVRVQNLLPACKNIGTTHVSNGCYRLHPVEWNIGDAAGALAIRSGRMQREGRIKVGWFHQHQIEAMDPDDTPLEIARRTMPEISETARRSTLAHWGLGFNKQETTVFDLSGGERARLLLNLVAKDAPHLLILDEPTNHLDIDSRRALLDALNEYEGAVILITHDRSLMELVADRLWLAADGTVAPFDGDMDDYARFVLDRAKGGTAAPTQIVREGKKKKKKAG